MYNNYLVNVKRIFQELFAVGEITIMLYTINGSGIFSQFTGKNSQLNVTKLKN